jgi:hypothetical protein
LRSESVPNLRERLEVCAQHEDFAGACRLAARHYRGLGARLARECGAAGIGYDAEFWPETAARAERAEAICREERMTAQRRTVERLRDEGLLEFLAGLEGGDYRLLMLG